jgi:RNA polymerase sigma-70 factor (ECF subfamily)
LQRAVVERTEELIARISKGDRHAPVRLFEENRHALLSYLRAITSDHGLAEEILQDTLFAVWTGAGTFQGSSSARTWMFAIARRRARDLLRKRVLPTTDLRVLDAVPSREPDPFDLAIAAEREDRLVQTIGALSAEHREALLLTFVHGFSYQELSEVLVVPIGTVKSRLFAAKRALRERLEHGQNDEGEPR